MRKIMDPKKIKPVWNGVLIRQKKAEEKTKGGVWMPDDAKDRDEHQEIFAEVYTVGSMAFQEFDEETNKYIVRDGYPKVGDTVMFRKYAGGNFIESFEDDDYRYRLVDQTDIIAVVEN